MLPVTSNTEVLDQHEKTICNIEKDLHLSIKKTGMLYNCINEKIIEIIDEKPSKTIKSYLFYSTDMTNIVAYSGKSLDLLIHLQSNGIITNLKLIKHSEPILLTGIPIEKLLEALSFYKNKNINKKISIGESASYELSIPIISGATVTSLILHETILESCKNAGIILKFIDKNNIHSGSLNILFKKMSWKKLINIGAIKHYSLNNQLKEAPNEKKNLLVDIYFADIKHPSIGKNLLGDYYYDILEQLSDNDSAIIILNNGTWSFKGSGFVRGGIYDRFRIEQNDNIFTFRDTNFQNVYELNLIDLNKIKESGIFIITNKKYKPWEPWTLALILDYKTFNIKYTIPKEFCKQYTIKWLQIWQDKIFYISLF